ncbi:MAG: hypothetical protein Q8Q14_06360 [Gemmatimonadales bacterium]|nr:hypothetical protein [Gemmatimonadales bacterium]
MRRRRERTLGALDLPELAETMHRDEAIDLAHSAYEQGQRDGRRRELRDAVILAVVGGTVGALASGLVGWGLGRAARRGR